MSELTTVLGFEASEAIKTLQTLDMALISYTKAMRKAASATRAFNKTGKDVEGTLNRIAKTTQATNTKVVRSYKNQTTAARKVAKVVEEGAVKQEKAAKKVLLSWQSVVRIFAIQVIHQMVTKVTNAMWEGVSVAREYEIAIAEIQTIGKEFRKDFEGLATQVRDFSDAVGAPIESVAEGVYQTLSNQVTDAAHAFDFMSDAQAFATASVTETQGAVALLSSVMNSYNIEISRSAEIGGKLAKIIELGRLRGEEFADTFGRITVLAAQLGIEFEEVGASIATMTVSGMKYNEASTLMLNIMLKLIRPTEELKKRYKELGISGAEAGIQAFSFQGFLAKLSESSGSSATELGKLFGRVRAIRGVMGLANENVEKYVENLEAIKAASAAELFEKRDIIFETNAKQVEIELNKLRNTMVDGFGRGMNDLLKATFDTFGGAQEAIEAVGAASVFAAAGLVILKLRAIQASAALAVTSTAFTPLIIVAAVTLAATAVFAFYNRMKAEAEDLRKSMEKQSGLELKNRLRNMAMAIDVQNAANVEMYADLQKYLFKRQVAFDEASENLIRLENLVFSGIVNQLGDKINKTNAFFDNLGKRAAAADTVIRNLNNTIRLVQFDISDFNFERETRSLDPLQKAYANIERSNALRIKIATAIHNKEFDLADLYIKRAKAAATAALSSADESRDRNVILKAEREVRKLYTDQVKLLERKKYTTQDEKKEIESVAKQIFLQKQELGFLNDEIKNTVEEFAKVRFDPVKREEVIGDLKKLASDAEEIFRNIKISFKLPETTDMRSMITGEKDTISKAINEGLTAITAKAEKITAPVTAVDLKLEELFPGAKTIEEYSQALINLEKSIKDSRDATLSQVTVTAEVDKLYKDTKTSLGALGRAYADAGGEVFLLEAVVADLLKLTGTQADVFARQNRITTDWGRAVFLTKEAIKLLNEEELDTKKFDYAKTSLVDLAATITDAEVKDAITILIDNLNALAVAKIEMREVSGAVLSPEEMETAVQKLAEASNALINLKDAAVVGEVGVSQSMLGIETSTQSAINKVKELNRELRMSITPKGKRFGGMIYRAGGGFIPRGSDTVPVMLTPGEFVVNAAASKQFYSQLVSMNSGVKPQYRQSGGAVFGDVNITVNESVSAQQTARETMQAFRRQTRRGAFTL